MPGRRATRRLLRLAALPLAFLLLSSCTYAVPRKRLPYPLATERFGDPVKAVAIPLPVIATTPTEGVTAGALAAFLLHDRNDEVDTLVAPQVNRNPNFGITASVYGVFYLSPHREAEINLSRSTRVNEDYGLRLRDKSLRGGKLSLDAFLYRFTDGSARFHGFGDDSPRDGETNFGDRETGVTLSAGYDLPGHLRVVLGDRARRVRVLPGAVSSLPFVRDRFDAAAVPGLDGFVTHAPKIALAYDTLDEERQPVRGVLARAEFERCFRSLGATATWSRYEGEIKAFLPLDDARYVTAARIAAVSARGASVPFLERSALGGERTLRGHGRNRYFDRASLLLNVEERIRLFRWRVFGVLADWELAPFVDAGRVAPSLRKAASGGIEVNPGIGVRAVVRPNIVGRIDVGRSGEGTAVFVVLGYPF